MDQYLISVIIPTYNRKGILKLTLEGLAKQDRDDFEIIVVDDGSNDGTEEMVSQFLTKTEMNLKYFKKDHAGQGIARNFGIEKAKGEHILFIGDDTVPREDLLTEHLKTHNNYQDVAVLGYVKWHPDLKTTDFMKWLAPCGFGFNFCEIKDFEDVNFGHFYTSNVSLKRKWLKEEKFDTDFKGYGFEDIDLGYRLSKKGLKIVYNPQAVVYHHHKVTLEEYCRKTKDIAQALKILSRKHPELSRRWVKPILPMFLFSNVLRKVPFLEKINKNLYFLSEVTYSKYKALKCLKS